MDRLTIRSKNESSSMIWMKDIEYSLEPCEVNSHHVRLLFEKLAHYEDLEEQDKLIELPCKVGDVVYSVDTLQVEEFKIKSLSHLCNLIEWGRFDEYVFLTRDDAELRLKELSNE